MASRRAVTFDFWNTLVRLSPTDPHRRRDGLADVFHDHGLDVAGDGIDGALGFVRERFDERWRANRQYVLADAVGDVLAVLGLDPSPRLVSDLHARWLADGQTTPIEVTEAAVGRVLEALRAGGLRIGIVCDAGLMPGAVLRGHLDRLGPAAYFDHMAFSDEVGVYKPDRRIFAAAFAGLGAQPAQVVHVGDLHRTDIVGARAAGAEAIRYRGVVDDEEALSSDETSVIDSLTVLVDRLVG